MLIRLPILTALTLFALLAHAKPPVQCPFNVPVVTIAPKEVAGFKWTKVIRPMDDPCLTHVAVEPANGAAWYVGSHTGLYMTKNSGQAWTKPLQGQVGALLLTKDGTVQLVYVGVGKNLYLSRDKGQHWTIIKTFTDVVRSLLVMNGKLYVGLGWSSHANAGGVFVSNLGGGFMTFKPFGPGHTGLIVWTLSGNPSTGAIYAGTEIFDHPQPYKPPFFRTLNGGNQWTNVANNLPWHAIDSAVRPQDGYVYALMEGLGTYGSANQGNNWTPPQQNPGLGTDLLMDPKNTKRLYAGRHRLGGNLDGGVFLSTNAGATYKLIGLYGAQISDIALNGTQTKLFVTAYASGLYIGTIP